MLSIFSKNKSFLFCAIIALLCFAVGMIANDVPTGLALASFGGIGGVIFSSPSLNCDFNVLNCIMCFNAENLESGPIPFTDAAGDPANLTGLTLSNTADFPVLFTLNVDDDADAATPDVVRHLILLPYESQTLNFNGAPITGIANIQAAANPVPGKNDVNGKYPLATAEDIKKPGYVKVNGINA